jgi:glycerophosphoryl diester phosphodiesterase
MSSSPLLIGHQGWPARYPGNTLAGFVAALAHVDGFELDVRRSKDGKLVLAHDPMIGPLVVADTPWSVLAEVDLGGGHRPALLDETLAALPGIPIQIEVKNDPMQPGYEADHRIGLEAAERARPGDTVTSFNWGTMARVRRIFPDVATGIILTAFHDLEGGFDHCLELGHRLLVPDRSLIRDSVAAMAGEVMITPWTVNDLEIAVELVSLGVSGIITDEALKLSPIRSPDEHSG